MVPIIQKQQHNNAFKRYLTFFMIMVCSVFWNCLAGLNISDTSSNIQLIKEKSFKSFFKLVRSPVMNLSKKQAWKKVVPEVKPVIIRSTYDSTEQPALFYNSGSDKKKPLFLALHSWSEDYLSRLSIPFGIWAVKNDWVLIHPNYRGTFTNPSATLSESAVQDILDAVDYAKKNALVDESRVYVCGFSGGAMATLVMVGRYPRIWAAASAWAPVYDLSQWYQTTKNARHNYSRHITNSCGGPPLPGTKAEEECRKRSVSTYLSNTREQEIPIYIAVGIKDRFVPPGHSLQAFNDLADKQDRISQEDIAFINDHHVLPLHLRDSFSEQLFEDAGFKVLFSRKSSYVTLHIFNGDHDILFNAGLYWLSQHKKPQE
jgi:dienelactone hydrolase